MYRHHTRSTAIIQQSTRLTNTHIRKYTHAITQLRTLVHGTFNQPSTAHYHQSRFIYCNQHHSFHTQTNHLSDTVSSIDLNPTSHTQSPSSSRANARDIISSYEREAFNLVQMERPDIDRLIEIIRLLKEQQITPSVTLYNYLLDAYLLLLVFRRRSIFSPEMRLPAGESLESLRILSSLEYFQAMHDVLNTMSTGGGQVEQIVKPNWYTYYILVRAHRLAMREESTNREGIESKRMYSYSGDHLPSLLAIYEDMLGTIKFPPIQLLDQFLHSLSRIETVPDLSYQLYQNILTHGEINAEGHRNPQPRWPGVMPSSHTFQTIITLRAEQLQVDACLNAYALLMKMSQLDLTQVTSKGELGAKSPSSQDLLDNQGNSRVTTGLIRPSGSMYRAMMRMILYPVREEMNSYVPLVTTLFVDMSSFQIQPSLEHLHLLLTAQIRLNVADGVENVYRYLTTKSRHLLPFVCQPPPRSTDAAFREDLLHWCVRTNHIALFEDVFYALEPSTHPDPERPHWTWSFEGNFLNWFAAATSTEMIQTLMRLFPKVDRDTDSTLLSSRLHLTMSDWNRLLMILSRKDPLLVAYREWKLAQPLCEDTQTAYSYQAWCQTQPTILIDQEIATANAPPSSLVVFNFDIGVGLIHEWYAAGYIAGKFRDHLLRSLCRRYGKWDKLRTLEANAEQTSVNSKPKRMPTSQDELATTPPGSYADNVAIAYSPLPSPSSSTGFKAKPKRTPPPVEHQTASQPPLASAGDDGVTSPTPSIAAPVLHHDDQRSTIVSDLVSHDQIRKKLELVESNTPPASWPTASRPPLPRARTIQPKPNMPPQPTVFEADSSVQLRTRIAAEVERMKQRESEPLSITVDHTVNTRHNQSKPADHDVLDRITATIDQSITQAVRPLPPPPRTKQARPSSSKSKPQAFLEILRAARLAEQSRPIIIDNFINAQHIPQHYRPIIQKVPPFMIIHPNGPTPIVTHDPTTERISPEGAASSVSTAQVDGEEPKGETAPPSSITSPAPFDSIATHSATSLPLPVDTDFLRTGLSVHEWFHQIESAKSEDEVASTLGRLIGAIRHFRGYHEEARNFNRQYQDWLKPSLDEIHFQTSRSYQQQSNTQAQRLKEFYKQFSRTAFGQQWDQMTTRNRGLLGSLVKRAIERRIHFQINDDSNKLQRCLNVSTDILRTFHQSSFLLHTTHSHSSFATFFRFFAERNAWEPAMQALYHIILSDSHERQRIRHGHRPTSLSDGHGQESLLIPIRYHGLTAKDQQLFYRMARMVFHRTPVDELNSSFTTQTIIRLVDEYADYITSILAPKRSAVAQLEKTGWTLFRLGLLPEEQIATKITPVLAMLKACVYHTKSYRELHHDLQQAWDYSQTLASKSKSLPSNALATTDAMPTEVTTSSIDSENNNNNMASSSVTSSSTITPPTTEPEFKVLLSTKPAEQRELNTAARRLGQDPIDTTEADLRYSVHGSWMASSQFQLDWLQQMDSRLLMHTIHSYLATVTGQRHSQNETIIKGLWPLDERNVLTKDEISILSPSVSALLHQSSPPGLAFLSTFITLTPIQPVPADDPRTEEDVKSQVNQQFVHINSIMPYLSEPGIRQPIILFSLLYWALLSRSRWSRISECSATTTRRFLHTQLFAASFETLIRNILQLSHLTPDLQARLKTFAADVRTLHEQMVEKQRPESTNTPRE